jgi:general secretion pathway protein G
MKHVQTHKITSPTSQIIHRRKRGFTLMEILLVMALLGGLVVLGLTQVGSILQGGQEDTVRIFVNDTMKASLFRYRIDNGRYPNTEEGLQALMAAPGGATNWKGPYMESLPADPWGSQYQYRSPGQKNTDRYDLFSFGGDGVESADDIGNWQ